MKRIWMLAAAGLAATTAVVVLAASGNAQTSGGQTLTFFEADKGSTFHFVDNAPKSPTRNENSRRFRFSVGDEFFFTNPVFDHKGGRRVGTLFGHGTIAKGTTFKNAALLGQFVLRLGGGQVTAAGLFRFADKTGHAAITGGTGNYEGAHGQVASTSVKSGSNDVVHLLP